VPMPNGSPTGPWVCGPGRIGPGAVHGGGGRPPLWRPQPPLRPHPTAAPLGHLGVAGEGHRGGGEVAVGRFGSLELECFAPRRPFGLERLAYTPMLSGRTSPSFSKPPFFFEASTLSSSCPPIGPSSYCTHAMLRWGPQTKPVFYHYKKATPLCPPPPRGPRKPTWRPTSTSRPPPTSSAPRSSPSDPEPRADLPPITPPSHGPHTAPGVPSRPSSACLPPPDSPFVLKEKFYRHRG